MQPSTREEIHGCVTPQLLKSAAAVGALSVSGVFAPAIAQAGRCASAFSRRAPALRRRPGENGIRATQWATERFNAAGRHRRAQDRAGDRGGVLAQGHHRALQQAGAAGEGRLRAGHHLDRRRPGARPGGRGGARADDLLGRHHAGRRRREDPQSALPVPQHRQRVRGDHVLAADHQALEGQVRHRRRHQSGLFLRPQQHGGVRRAAQALQHRAQGGHRAVAEGRHHGPHQPRRRAQGRQARPDLLVAAVRRPARVHETSARRRADQGHQAGVPRGRLAAHADEEGVHAGRHAVRPQHALLRQSRTPRRWRRNSSTGTRKPTRTIRSGKPIAPISPSPPTRRRWRRPPRRKAAAGRRRTTSSTRWSGCRWKASAARAPGARTTSPTRPSCRASPPTTTSTTSSRSAASRRCSRPTCRSPPGANFWDWIKTAQFKV